MNTLHNKIGSQRRVFTLKIYDKSLENTDVENMLLKNNNKFAMHRSRQSQRTDGYQTSNMSDILKMVHISCMY